MNREVTARFQAPRTFSTDRGRHGKDTGQEEKKPAQAAAIHQTIVPLFQETALVMSRPKQGGGHEYATWQGDWTTDISRAYMNFTKEAVKACLPASTVTSPGATVVAVTMKVYDAEKIGNVQPIGTKVDYVVMAWRTVATQIVPGIDPVVVTVGKENQPAVNRNHINQAMAFAKSSEAEQWCVNPNKHVVTSMDNAKDGIHLLPRDYRFKPALRVFERAPN